jgi:microcompartment protein CcmK/EutM
MMKKVIAVAVVLGLAAVAAVAVVGGTALVFAGGRQYDYQANDVLGAPAFDQTADAFLPATAAGASLPGKGGPQKGGPQLIDVAADQLGMTRDELLAQISAGRSIAQIAESKNVPLDKIIDAFLAPRQTKLDAAVTAGKLTQEEEDALLVLARGRVERALSKERAPSLLYVASDQLGMTQDELVTKLRAGQTLRQVIEANGKVTVDQVVAAFVAGYDERLAQAVTDGKLTQAEADALKVVLKGRATRLMDQSYPWKTARQGLQGLKNRLGQLRQNRLQGGFFGRP